MAAVDRFQNIGIFGAIFTSRASWVWACMISVFALLPGYSHAGSTISSKGSGDLVKIWVHVTDANGDPVTGLTKSDFQLTEDGQPIEDFNLVEPTVDPVAVVLLMDYSQSMRNGDAITPMQEGVTNFINAMNPQDYAAIVKFNRDIGVRVYNSEDPFQDKTTLLAGLPDLLSDPGGAGTNLYDAVHTGVNLFSNKPCGSSWRKCVVILLTDGDDDRNSSTTFAEMINSVSVSDVLVYVLGVGSAINAGNTYLSQLAEGSGGKYVPVPDASGVSSIYSGLAVKLQDEYLLTYVSNVQGGGADTSLHEVVVTVAGQSLTVNFSRVFKVDDPAAGGGDSGGGGAMAGTAAWLLMLLGLIMLRLRARSRI